MPALYTIAAIRHHDKTGNDQMVDVSLFEASVLGLMEFHAYPIVSKKDQFLSKEHEKGFLLCGTPNQIVEKIEVLRSVGFDQIITIFPPVVDLKSIHLFAKEVTPVFKNI